MNKLQGFLTILVVALSIACIALIVTVSKLNQEPEKLAQVVAGQQERQTSSEPEPEPEITVNDTKEPISVPEPESNLKDWERNVRLPKHLIPHHYDLYLHPNLETGLFNGQVTIHIEARKTSDYFLVHTKYLDITQTKLRNAAGSTVPIQSAFEFRENEFWVVEPEYALPSGNYSLFLEFSGNLTKGITGFYKSVYTNAKGEKVSIATSKFQPTYARKAFPCFDEPSFKSTFSVTLVRPTNGYVALSNMPIESEAESSPTPGQTAVKFQKSVPMVTYLACFIVCDFEYEEKLTTIHNTKFRVYATPEQSTRVKYALDIGANITDFFTDYYEIPYPLPKQDMIAIPDFVSGAMEHWGLITYRETNLLYDSQESSSANQQRVATVVSHELAHQWFGNLVTLEWWDDLWLNEGFASYMEYKGVANYHPDWEMESQFLTLDLHRVLDLDATINSHPIVQEVAHPDQITEIFDTISYAKGASVLRMLEQFMGAEEFRKGVHLFLKRYKYRNAVTNDLWQALEEVSTKQLPIKKIMDSWTRQMGYPVVQIEKLGPGEYRVKQERYLTDQDAWRESAPSPYDYKWEVPITWIHSGNNQSSLKWLGKEESMTEVSVPSTVDWVKFNVGQFGFYRVNYPAQDWENLAQLLVNNPDALGPMDRASLLNDAFSLAESGHIGYNVPMAMTKYLSKEKHLVPWDTTYDKLISMGKLLQKTSTYRLYRNYIVDIISDHYDRLGWEDEGSHVEKMNRYNILGLACKNGHRGCNEEAKNIFQKWIKDETVYIKPNIRTLVYKYGMAASGDADTWEILFQRYLREKNAQEKRKLLYGLAQIKEPWVLHRFIDLAKDESNIRSQDYFSALSYISNNPSGNMLVWNFVQSEWKYLVQRFTLNDRYLGRLPKTVVEGFSTEFELKQVQRFFEENPEAGAGARARKQAVEQIENNIKWLKEHREVVHNWLEERNNVER